MRIGILTLMGDKNPGTYWQACTTHRALSETFPEDEVRFINFRQWPLPTGLGLGLLAKLKFDTFARSRRKRRIYAKIWKSLPLWPGSLLTEDYQEAQQFFAQCGCDLLVLGSDTCLHCWGGSRLGQGQTPAYWISPEVGVPHVALSSSADITKYTELSKDQIAIMQRSLSGFAQFGARDQMTIDLVGQLSPEDKHKVHRVPDPTFTAPINTTAADRYWQRKGLSGKKICAVHLKATSFTRELVSMLSKEYTVVGLSLAFPHTAPLDDMGPMEWQGIFKHFSLVVTASFHESIYSLKHGVPVFPLDAAKHRIDMETGQSKTSDLMRNMRLPEHHINPYSGISPEQAMERIEAGMAEFDRTEIQSRVASEAERYLSYVISLKELPDIDRLKRN